MTQAISVLQLNRLGFHQEAGRSSRKSRYPLVTVTAAIARGARASTRTPNCSQAGAELKAGVCLEGSSDVILTSQDAQQPLRVPPALAEQMPLPGSADGLLRLALQHPLQFSEQPFATRAFRKRKERLQRSELG